MRKAFSGVALAILSLAFIVLTAGSGHATALVDGDANKVRISVLHYNAKGADTVTNAWQEGVLIKNMNVATTSEVTLTDWRIHDTYQTSSNVSAWNDRFTNECAITGIALSPGETLYVTSSSETYRESAKRIKADNYVFCDFAVKSKGFNGGIFNNMGDTAYLENKVNGVQHVVSQMSYGFDDGYYIR